MEKEKCRMHHAPSQDFWRRHTGESFQHIKQNAFSHHISDLDYRGLALCGARETIVSTPEGFDQESTLISSSKRQNGEAPMGEDSKARRKKNRTKALKCGSDYYSELGLLFFHLFCKKVVFCEL